MWQRVWSQQADYLAVPEGPVGVTFPNYIEPTKMWKPAALTVGIKGYNIASGVFGLCMYYTLTVTPLL